MTPDALPTDAVPVAAALLPLTGALLFAFATMAMYAGRCATIGPPPEAAEEARRPSIVPAWFRSWWRWVCSPLVRVCLRMGVPGEAVALLGITASGFAGVSVVYRSIGFGGWMYLLATSLAAIGTQLARAEGRPARAAVLLDGTLGRLAELMLLGALAYAVRDHDLALPAALTAMGATMLASDARLRSEALGAGLPSRIGSFARPERALLIGVPCALVPATDRLFGAGTGLDVVSASLALVSVLAIVAAIRRTFTAHDALRTMDAIAEAPPEAAIRRLRVVRGGRQ